MEVPGIDPGILTCKVRVLPIRLYPLLEYTKNDFNVNGNFTSLFPVLILFTDIIAKTITHTYTSKANR